MNTKEEITVILPKYQINTKVITSRYKSITGTIVKYRLTDNSDFLINSECYLQILYIVSFVNKNNEVKEVEIAENNIKLI